MHVSPTALVTPDKFRGRLTAGDRGRVSTVDTQLRQDATGLSVRPRHTDRLIGQAGKEK